uniref:hypothetical protein n=1 Tax=Klebsiella variicola TaxID=244366 RepID=UPI001F5FAF23
AGELSIREQKFLKLAKAFKQLAAENAALKSFGDKLCEMHNALNGEGTGIQGRAEVACQQVALEAAMEEFDAIETPATDRIVAGIKADGVEQYAALFADTVNMEREHNQQFHKGTLWFAKQLREGADK